MKFDLLSAIRFTRIELSVFSGGEPLGISMTLASLQGTLYVLSDYLKGQGLLDDAKIRVIPCYTSDPTTVNFSIRIFSSLAMLLTAFTHTTRGEKNEKRSDRSDNG